MQYGFRVQYPRAVVAAGHDDRFAEQQNDAEMVAHRISHVDTNELSGAGRQREAAAGNGFDLIVPKISWSSGGNAGGAGGTGD